MAVYTTIHSSNHAGAIDTSRAEHALFPTTSRLSRKHHPLSDNHSCISDKTLAFNRNASCVTIKARFPFSPFSPLSPYHGEVIGNQESRIPIISPIRLRVFTGNWKLVLSFTRNSELGTSLATGNRFIFYSELRTFFRLSLSTVSQLSQKRHRTFRTLKTIATIHAQRCDIQ
jgi:hypothetical protein